MSVAYELFPVADAADSGIEPGVPSRLSSPRPEPRLFLVPPPVPTAAPHRRRLITPTGPGYVAAPIDGVTVLQPPADAPSIRLTRRGVVAIAVMTGLLAATLVVLAALSAHASGAGRQASTGAGPAAVTVQAGDTLWSIASSAAPGVDPRAEVATLARLNHISGEALVPGQRLRLR